MCGPRQPFFFQCGPGTPQGWTPLRSSSFLVTRSIKFGISRRPSRERSPSHPEGLWVRAPAGGGKRRFSVQEEDERLLCCCFTCSGPAAQLARDYSRAVILDTNILRSKPRAAECHKLSMGHFRKVRPQNLSMLTFLAQGHPSPNSVKLP